MNLSPLEPSRPEIEELIRQGKSNSEIAKKYHTSEKSVRRARKRWGKEKTFAEPVGLKVQGDMAEVTGSISSSPYASPEELLRERGLDPSDWGIESLTVNEWDSPTGEVLKQLRATVKRKKPIDIVLPARPEGYKRPKPNKRPSSDSTLVALLSDQHVPHHDLHLHECTLQWLRENSPDVVYLMGDLLDLPEVSRHRHDPAWKASTQECIQDGYEVLRDYVGASKRSEWYLMEGNHEARLRNYLIDNARELYGLTRASEDWEIPEAIHSLTHLLRLDELGVHQISTEGTYEHAKAQVSQHLGVIHGTVATKKSGASAHRALEQYGHSIAQGHSHRASQIFKTVYDIAGNPETLTGVEVGCMCKIEGGLGYHVNGDWQQGFGTVTVWPDGEFHVELGTYVNGSLYWRDKRYS